MPSECYIDGVTRVRAKLSSRLMDRARLHPSPQRPLPLPLPLPFPFLLVLLVFLHGWIGCIVRGRKPS